MTTYTVKATRSGDWWALEVPEVPGVFTQARRLSSAPSMARDAIALMLDVDPSTVRVHLEPELDADVAAVVAEAKELGRQAEELRDRAAALARDSVRALLRAGLTQAEAAVVLDVSAQRLSQLVATAGTSGKADIPTGAVFAKAAALAASRPRAKDTGSGMVARSPSGKVGASTGRFVSRQAGSSAGSGVVRKAGSSSRSPRGTDSAGAGSKAKK